MNEKVKVAIQYILIICASICIFRFFVIPIRIQGHSMDNNFQNGDIAIVNHLGIKLDNIERFDIVVLKSEILNETIIKRVIGLPGETIEFVNDQLFVNGRYIAQDFLDIEFVNQSKITYNEENFTRDFKVIVKSDEIFVMGDNRLRSTDSRDLGGFKRESIIGTKGFILYPFSNVKWIE